MRAATIAYVAFAVVYLYAFGKPARWIYLAALAACAVPILVVQGSMSASLLPFFVAHLIFCWPPRKALFMIACLYSTSTAALIIFDPEALRYLWAPALVVPVLITFIGYISNREDSRQQLRHELDLAHQRETIARDVHDLLGHSLTVINLKAQVAQRTADPSLKEELASIAELAREGLRQVRSTVTELREPSLASELASAKRALHAAGIQAEVPHMEAHPFSSLFAWVLREAVTNVIRHANATTCTVEITDNSLTVRDDGPGITASPGNGLRGMRRRVEAAGGTLTLGNGVEVTM